MKIEIKIEPNEMLVQQAMEAVQLPIPVDREEKHKYDCRLEEILNKLLEHKNKFYNDVLGDVFNNKTICTYLSCCNYIPIEVTEDEEIENAISLIFKRKIKLYREDTKK